MPAITPTLRGDDEVDATALWQAGGVVGLLALTYVAFLKGWILTSREGDDIRGQRDRADDRVEKLLNINATQSEALREFARRDDLAVYSLEAIKKRVAEKGGDA